MARHKIHPAQIHKPPIEISSCVFNARVFASLPPIACRNDDRTTLESFVAHYCCTVWRMASWRGRHIDLANESPPLPARTINAAFSRGSLRADFNLARLYRYCSAGILAATERTRECPPARTTARCMHSHHRIEEKRMRSPGHKGRRAK